MEASPLHHHPFLLDQSHPYPNSTMKTATGATTMLTTATCFSDEYHQPHDLFIPNGTIEVSAHSDQISICNNFQSSISQMPMVVHGDTYEKTMTNSYGLTKKTCKKTRNQNKSNIDHEKNKNVIDSKEGRSGYVYVRARRGEATDSHSLAERVRREKISEKMKALQAIVPGCDKITGKALLLEEVIHYVQSLQNEVQFLSSKLACVNPMYGYGADFDASMLKPHQNMTTDQEQLLSQEHQMSNMVFENNREVMSDFVEQSQELAAPFSIINSFNSVHFIN